MVLYFASSVMINIYNEAFDAALNNFNLKARSENLTRAYMPWMPDFREVVPLKGKIIRIPDNSNFGLRGIVNVGNSCYINCVIQVLMHTPVLVNHFLSDKHICSLSDSCLWCELHYIFQEFYSFKSTPFDPSERLFNALQKFCKQPLGMEQQDSYELFQEILMGLHANCPKKTPVTDCNCMIQKIFYGIIQGLKKCTYCNDSSFLPPDYFMDILLDLDKNDDSLVNVLRRKYLEPQLLSDYKCSNCQKTDTTYSYQHIKKLPKVICFRMNCFLLEFNKNAPIRSRNRKISKKSTAFAFEEFIDMMPYLNSKGAANISDGKKASLNPSENFYKLFAVIFHEGTAQGGHYLAYVRHRNTKCSGVSCNLVLWIMDLLDAKFYLSTLVCPSGKHFHQISSFTAVNKETEFPELKSAITAQSETEESTEC
ncbi:Ubiquitin carboxyl-terminal hydrolase 22 like protein [Argiope bruennichi]|uniref:Ubiquitin carboxyl-terminal hydrolase n=1 Tax=Argiope bruennichi TaxID=94029 RepID=A0A8T0F892_ARGBR|nr:Ubiquitin carboxyl-terminal hydrolase 22 like protein [Argiope bruennichi]